VQVRRNILVSGIPVDHLVGAVLVLDSGNGPVRLSVQRPANPCAWMDVAIRPGGMAGVAGQGRCPVQAVDRRHSAGRPGRLRDR
jgi:hypothetical protein